MRFDRHAFSRTLLSAAFAMPAIVLGAPSNHAQARARLPLDTRVIAVYDATATSQCKMWNGDDVAHAWSCPAGSVVYSNPTVLAVALARGYRYVVPTTDLVATRAAIDTTANDISTNLLAHTSIASKFGPLYDAFPRHNISHVHLLGRTSSPATRMSCGAGYAPTDSGHYLGNGGGTISYQVRFIEGNAVNGGACPISAIQDQDSQSQPANTPRQYWDYSVVGSSGNIGHNCENIPIGSYTGWNNEPDAYYNDRYENHAANGSNCTYFDGDSYGFRYLT